MISDKELERYKRQMLSFGEEGQKKLKKAKIFVAGAGGLGSPASIYLAVAGIGAIIVADMDAVEATNLNRQVLHYESDIGRRKTDSAREKLAQLNPYINIETIDAAIDESNVFEFISGTDGIVDAMDNFQTRYILNDAALKAGIPFFHGGVRGFYGQATTVIPGETGCLRCLFPNPPPKETFPVIGTTPGIIGMVQATEVIKYITGTGELLKNRLFLWDGMKIKAGEIRFSQNSSCQSCGNNSD